MAFEGGRRFVGLGFGAVQAGLFTYEAHRAGVYASPLVIDVRPDLVAGLRSAGGHVRVNIARAHRIDVATIGPVDVADPSAPEDRDRIVKAIAGADELASALPSVASYASEATSSPHRLLAEGLARRTRDVPLIVFCAENHRNAAALLEGAVLEIFGPRERDALRDKARFVDTVIGKMGGVITNRHEVGALGLATVTMDLSSAFLVEEFDRILVSRVDPAGDVHPGMPALHEVDDLAPFEDVKLLGHNATHALGAFLGQLQGISRFAELREVPGAMAFLRRAFIEESGRTLIGRYAGRDPLFTLQGYTDFADDLLARMANPFLSDSIERAARDPHRKLGWDDRLIGLIRMGLAQGVPTPRYAMGVVAGLDVLRRDGSAASDTDLLTAIWPSHVDDTEAAAVFGAVARGRAWLARWHQAGFAGLTRDD